MSDVTIHNDVNTYSYLDNEAKTIRSHGDCRSNCNESNRDDHVSNERLGTIPEEANFYDLRNQWIN